MGYHRVLPRDAFNEANLIKCYGQLWLELEKLGLEETLITGTAFNEAGFMIEQSAATGAIYVENVRFIVKGQRIELWRPLNSREPYPLLASLGYDEGDVNVFNPVSGTLSDDFIKLLIEAQQ